MEMPKIASHPLSELYGRWALNSLVELAYVLSHDVAVRPQYYQQLSAETANIIAGFRFKLGSDPDWPDAFQRALNFKVLLQVCVASPQVREAALRHAENPGGEMQEAFRVAAANCREQLAPLEGQALALVARQTQPIFERAVTLFRDAGITQAFGLPPVPQESWPLGSNFSGNAAYTIAELIRGLGRIACLSGAYKRIRFEKSGDRPLVPRLGVSLPQDKFLKLQRAAYYGGTTIAHLMSSRDLGSSEVIEGAY